MIYYFLLQICGKKETNFQTVWNPHSRPLPSGPCHSQRYLTFTWQVDLIKVFQLGNKDNVWRYSNAGFNGHEEVEACIGVAPNIVLVAKLEERALLFQSANLRQFIFLFFQSCITYVWICWVTKSGPLCSISWSGWRFLNNHWLNIHECVNIH